MLDFLTMLLDGASIVLIAYLHVLISPTYFTFQHWEYDKGSNRIRHVGSGKCLDSKDQKEKGLTLNSCSDSFTQSWTFEVTL